MPPKPKLNQSNGKHKAPICAGNSNEKVGLSSESQQQFEIELCWCIQQLQIALKSGKLNNKQTQDHVKTLNSLMSNSTPLIKKRQIMRLSFGDYRTKMSEENKKHNPGNTKVKIFSTAPSKKSVFLKKSLGGDFKFNFNVENKDKIYEGEISKDISHIKLQDETCLRNNSSCDFQITPSSNSFRFNFDTKSE